MSQFDRESPPLRQKEGSVTTPHDMQQTHVRESTEIAGLFREFLKRTTLNGYPLDFDGSNITVASQAFEDTTSYQPTPPPPQTPVVGTSAPQGRSFSSPVFAGAVGPTSVEATVPVGRNTAAGDAQLSRGYNQQSIRPHTKKELNARGSSQQAPHQIKLGQTPHVDSDPFIPVKLMRGDGLQAIIALVQTSGGGELDDSTPPDSASYYEGGFPDLNAFDTDGTQLHTGKSGLGGYLQVKIGSADDVAQVAWFKDDYCDNSDPAHPVAKKVWSLRSWPFVEA